MSNLDQVPAALVMEDRGADDAEGKPLEYGDDIAQALVDRDSFDFRELDRRDALEGVDDGSYDFALIIPRDFSASLAGVAADVDAARIRMVTNDAHSYLSTTIANQLVVDVREAIAQEVSQKAANTFLQGLEGGSAPAVDLPPAQPVAVPRDERDEDADDVDALVEWLVSEGYAEPERDVGLEEADRVRIERGDDHRPPLVESALDRAPDHRLVAEVESVEIAEGDDAPLEVRGDAAIEGQALHCSRPLSALPPGCKSLRQMLDSAVSNSYLQHIPIHRFPAAHSCARRFFV